VSNSNRLQEDAFNLDLVGFTDEEVEELLREPETTGRADRSGRGSG
jgi:hypothetical protein